MGMELYSIGYGLVSMAISLLYTRPFVVDMLTACLCTPFCLSDPKMLTDAYQEASFVQYNIYIHLRHIKIYVCSLHPERPNAEEKPVK